MEYLKIVFRVRKWSVLKKEALISVDILSDKHKDTIRRSNQEREINFYRSVFCLAAFGRAQFISNALSYMRRKILDPFSDYCNGVQAILIVWHQNLEAKSRFMVGKQDVMLEVMTRINSYEWRHE